MLTKPILWITLLVSILLFHFEFIYLSIFIFGSLFGLLLSYWADFDLERRKITVRGSLNGCHRDGGTAIENEAHEP